MLYLIGLGLNNEKDITVNGLEVVRRAERVYLEAYTAILMVGKDRLVCVPLADSAPLPVLEGTDTHAKVGSILWQRDNSSRPGDGGIRERINPC